MEKQEHQKSEAEPQKYGGQDQVMQYISKCIPKSMNIFKWRRGDKHCNEE